MFGIEEYILPGLLSLKLIGKQNIGQEKIYFLRTESKGSKQFL